jgi:hypothetical protein
LFLFKRQEGVFSNKTENAVVAQLKRSTAPKTKDDELTNNPMRGNA